MSLHPAHHSTDKNLFGHANVSIGKNYENIQNPQTTKALYDTLHPLVTTKPNWKFVATDFSHYNGAPVATKFVMYEDGELLGRVHLSYHGRNYKIHVGNDRIDAKRERGKGYKTESPEKATLAIRRNMFKLSDGERIAKLIEGVEAVLAKQHSHTAWDVQRAERELLCNADEFATQNVQAYLQAFPNNQPHYDKLVTRREQYMVVDTVKKAFDNKDALIVLSFGDTYIVIEGGKQQKYDHDTLPYYLREKVGLLKLVKEEQMISGVGCRVSADAFVVLPEVKEQA